MTSNNSRMLLALLSLISLILLAALTLGFYKIGERDKKISRLLDLVDQRTREQVLAQSVRTVKNTAREDIEAFGSFILTEDRLVSVIDQIEEAGQALDLEVAIISVSKIEDQKSLEPDTVRMVIESKGSWSGSLLFLRAIESLPQRVMIEESNLSRDEVSWRSRIIVSLYLFD